MKILIIGSGGREHAIAWKLRQSVGVEKIWCAPGNGGIARVAECVPLDVSDVRAAADLAQKLGADLTIVGPELPLVNGISDEFTRLGLTILGPGKNAAQLEGSKIFAKRFMERHGIPTAESTRNIRIAERYRRGAGICEMAAGGEGGWIVRGEGRAGDFRGERGERIYPAAYGRPRIRRRGESGAA